MDQFNKTLLEACTTWQKQVEWDSFLQRNIETRIAETDGWLAFMDKQILLRKKAKKTSEDIEAIKNALFRIKYLLMEIEIPRTIHYSPLCSC